MSTETTTGTGARPPPDSLLPGELRERIPALYATEDAADPIVHAKLFTPWTTWTWFVTEFDGQETCFGLVCGHEVELGYFNLAELEAIEGPHGLRIERDLHFRPQPLSKVREDLERLRSEPDGTSVHEGREGFNEAAAANGHEERKPPSPFDEPGVRLVETRLATSGLAADFGSISTPSAAAAILHRLIGEADCEHFAALFLNGKHRITHAHIVSRGTAQTAPVHPREVFKAAVIANAAAIVVGHNHPSGDVQPSPDDRAVGERLERAGELLGIPVLDSLIVGPAGRFFAASTGDTLTVPSAGPSDRTDPPNGRNELAVVCRGLLQDIDEVLERQGEDWWDETVTSGTYHRSRAERLFGLEPYEPLVDDADRRDTPGEVEPA